MNKLTLLCYGVLCLRTSSIYLSQFHFQRLLWEMQVAHFWKSLILPFLDRTAFPKNKSKLTYQ
jgi:hypothetical protein